MGASAVKTKGPGRGRGQSGLMKSSATSAMQQS